MQQKKHSIFNRLIIATVSMAATLVAACSTDTVYDSYAHTPINGWEKNDTLTFNTKPLEFSGKYSQYVGLRMTTAFPFTSISLIVEQQILPKGKTVTDTIKCPITDIRGNFLGDGVSSYQYEFPLREINLHRGDSLHVSIRHNMKREILPGVSDIGLKMKIRN